MVSTKIIKYLLSVFCWEPRKPLYSFRFRIRYHQRHFFLGECLGWCHRTWNSWIAWGFQPVFHHLLPDHIVFHPAARVLGSPVLPCLGQKEILGIGMGGDLSPSSFLLGNLIIYSSFLRRLAFQYILRSCDKLEMGERSWTAVVLFVYRLDVAELVTALLSQHSACLRRSGSHFPMGRIGSWCLLHLFQTMSGRRRVATNGPGPRRRLIQSSKNYVTHLFFSLSIIFNVL